MIKKLIVAAVASLFFGGAGTALAQTATPTPSPSSSPMVTASPSPSASNSPSSTMMNSGGTGGTTVPSGAPSTGAGTE